MRILIRSLTISVAFSLFVLAGVSPAAADDSWHYSVTPYLWLPTINASLNYELPPELGDKLAIEAGPNDYLTHLKFAAMVSGDARKGRYSLLTDVIYLDLANEDSTLKSVDIGGGNLPVDTNINRNTQTSLKGLTWMFAGGYTLNGNSESPVDVIAGVRYLGLDTSAKWDLTATINGPGSGQTFPRTGSISKRANLWDGIVGLRGRAKINDRWHIPYYVDAGAGGSKLTWQAMTGVTYGYHWGDLGLVYRHLSYESSGTVQKLSFSGPAFSLGFHF